MKFIIEIADEVLEKTEVGLEFPTSAAEMVLTGRLNQHGFWCDDKIKVWEEIEIADES